MESTIRRMAKVLGASAVESSGHNARFEAVSAAGDRLRVSLGADQQRLMAVLQDTAGHTRCTIDVGPISHVTEDPGSPGRATVHIGRLLIHIDSQPTLSIEVVNSEIAD